MPISTDPPFCNSPPCPPPDFDWLDEFVSEGLTVEVLARLESGKEATARTGGTDYPRHDGTGRTHWHSFAGPPPAPPEKR